MNELENKNLDSFIWSSTYARYEKNILKQIKKNDLTKFRSWPGGAGVGSIHSFGGGERELHRYFKRNFHPFDLQYYKFDNNFFNLFTFFIFSNILLS